MTKEISQDHNDLFVLDLAPSLKTLTILTIIENNLSTEVGVQSSEKILIIDEICFQGLPRTLLTEIRNMTVSNSISKPLRTVESLPTG